MQLNVFIIGSKGIPAKYGGFETFVEKLTKHWGKKDVKFHIACLDNNVKDDYIYNKARCFTIKKIKIYKLQTLIYDLMSLNKSLQYIKENKLHGSIIYMLTYRIGPFLIFFKQRIKKNNISLYLNPDGLEYKRRKWNKLIKLYWKISRSLTLGFVDLIICDSREIQKIIIDDFKKISNRTTYISYGAEFINSVDPEKNIEIFNWFRNINISKDNYYLNIGRLIPENNFELIINEYINSESKKILLFITNIKYENNYYKYLNKKFNLEKNKKILFLGAIYDEALLNTIRGNAFAYIHGHEVGGTNPSLLEALAFTKINLVLRVAFNVEVCKDSVVYFEKSPGSLKDFIIKIEKQDLYNLESLSQKAKNRIKEYYSWDKVVKEYEKIF
jgi:rhamnosyltransferase